MKNPNNKTASCPQCGRVGLRTLTWNELGIAETTTGCWDCAWLTYPSGVTAENWKKIMMDHQQVVQVPRMGCRVVVRLAGSYAQSEGKTKP